MLVKLKTFLASAFLYTQQTADAALKSEDFKKISAVVVLFLIGFGVLFAPFLVFGKWIVLVPLAALLVASFVAVQQFYAPPLPVAAKLAGWKSTEGGPFINQSPIEADK